MKKQLPKTCITCKFMDFVDYECEVTITKWLKDKGIRK